jgi:hypothetical protein
MNTILNHFQHLTLSSDQQKALLLMEDFLKRPEQIFLLKGYAGSGKTTILKGFIEYLKSVEKPYTLMAPTGRAAKVIREKTGIEAYTIHKTIYSFSHLVEARQGDSFIYQFKLRNNMDVHNHIFIADEASMISQIKMEGEFFRFGSGHLLNDLIEYTRLGIETTNTKIIFIGDPCQLPPVGENNSRAFDPDYLKSAFGLTSIQAEMKEVKRQSNDSGILKSAAKIRKSLSSGYFTEFSLLENGKDILNPSFENFLDTWEEAQSPKIIIAYKNKTCLDLNNQIRKRKFDDDNLPIQKGDILIMGGNNYRKGVFSGEFAVVNDSQPSRSENVVFYPKTPENAKSIKKVATEVLLKWRYVELVFPDAEESNKIVKGQVLENFLYGDNNLNPIEIQALYVDFKNRHKDLKPGSEEFKEAIVTDDYFNCLLVKYGYAVTCHKSQGGEWSNVFTVWDHDNREEFNCLKDTQTKTGKTNDQYYRWAYTAITRASKTLFAINPPQFNSYSSLTIVESATLQGLKELSGQAYQPEAISLDKELSAQLKTFNLFDEPLQFQDHFIKVRHAVRKFYIEITSWKKVSYEVHFQFERVGKTAALKTWFKKDFSFSGSQMIPQQTNDQDLYQEIEEIVKCLPNISVKRNTVETVLSKVIFDNETEEKFPFTKNLYDDLEAALESQSAVITDVEHFQYKERYTIARGSEQVVVDFEYKQNGFWGRVIPLERLTNSPLLWNDVQNAINILKL